MDPTTVLTLLISGLALGVPVVALAWQFARSRWERPVVVVRGGIGGHSNSTQREPRTELLIEVTNIGERAVTLVEVGWITATDNSSMNYIGLLEEEVAEFPVRLDAHDSRSWRIDCGPTREPGIGGLPYARIVQRPTWLEKRRTIGPERTVVGQLGAYDFPDPKTARVAMSPRAPKRSAK